MDTNGATDVIIGLSPTTPSVPLKASLISQIARELDSTSFSKHMLRQLWHARRRVIVYSKIWCIIEPNFISIFYTLGSTVFTHVCRLRNSDGFCNRMFS